MKKTPKSVVITVVILFIASFLVGCSKNVASGDVTGKLELAIKYLAENKYEEAILAYQEIIKIDAKNVAAYKGLSLAYELQDKKDEAEKVLQDGLKAAGQVSGLQMALAGFYAGIGRTDQAEAIYKELIKGDNSLLAYRAYSTMLAAGGKTPDAIALLEQAVQANTDYRLGSLLAELYINSGEKDKALAMLKKSLEGRTEQSTAYTLLSRLYNGNMGDMLALGEQMVQQGDTTAGELIKLSALYGLGRYEDLVGEYQKAGDEIKNNNRARLLLAQTYSKLGNKDAALGIISAVDPGTLKDAGFLAEIAGYYLDAGDKETARTLALQGIGMEQSLVENYVVMYKSYADEDMSMSQIWALKYLLSSFLSYKDGLAQLSDYGLKFSFVYQAEEELISKEIVSKIVRDQAHAEKMLRSYPNWLRMTSSVYLDTKNNIAYQGCAEKASGWEPIIIRHHSPAICTKENIPPDIMARMQNIPSGSMSPQRRQEYNLSEKFILAPGNLLQEEINNAYPVDLEGDIPFEEHLKKANYPIENITFIDR